jgi:hypothetical protein
MSLRLAPSAVQPKGIPTLSVRTDHLCRFLHKWSYVPLPIMSGSVVDCALRGGSS